MRGSTVAIRCTLLLVIVSTGLTACKQWNAVQEAVRRIPQCKYVLEHATKAAVDYYEINGCSQSSSKECNCAICSRLANDPKLQNQHRNWYDRQCQVSFARECLQAYYCTHRTKDLNLDGNVKGCAPLRAVLPKGPSECSA